VPANCPVDECDHAFGEPGKLVGLEVRTEGQARNIEQGMPGARGQPLLDADVRHARAARRVLESAGGADIIASDCQARVIAAQRIEARVGIAVGDGETGIDRQIAVPVAPASLAIAEQQGHCADRRLGLGEFAAQVRAGEASIEARRIEHDRRFRLAEPHAQVAEHELLVGDRAARRLEVQRRSSQPAVKRGAG